MSSHDFKALHDKEFEALCADLLGVSMSVRFERFKPGPDQGVDARCFEAGGGEIILLMRALAGPVHVAVVAALTDADLDPATLAVVEPVRRLAHRPQWLPPEALDSARAGRRLGKSGALALTFFAAA